MTNSTIFAIAALGIVGLYFLNKARTAKFLNYHIARTTISFSGITPILKMEIAIENPSGNSFTVKSIAGSLVCNNVPISEITSFNAVTILPNAVTIYPLNFRLSIRGVLDAAAGIISDIVAVFNGQGMPQQVEFEGAANVDNITVPVNFKYTIG